MNAKANFLLLAAVVAAALALVRSTYEARSTYAALERARAEEQQLQAEYRRLDVERQAQAAHLRVEKTAREKLGMRVATPAVTYPVSGAGTGGEMVAVAPAAAGARR